MTPENIIQNILTEPEQINGCLDALNKSKTANASSLEQFHISRYIALENINFENIENTTSTFSEICNEIKNSVLTASIINDNEEDTVTALKVSGIIDTILRKMSANERKIYLYRYFFMYPIDNVAALCNCSSNNVEKALSSANSSLKNELKKANIDCSLKTMLTSIADIDNTYLEEAINNTSRKKAFIASDNFNKEDKKEKKLNQKVNGKTNNKTENTAENKSEKTSLFSYKKMLNICFAIIAIILVIVNIKFITSKPDDKSSKKSSSNNTNENNEANEPSEFDNIFTQLNGKEYIDTNTLLNYVEYSVYNEITVDYPSDYFTGTYSSVPLVSDLPLEDCIGEEIAFLSSSKMNYYKLLGHDDAKYIVREYLDTYTLLVLTDFTLNNDIYESNGEITVNASDIFQNFLGINVSHEIKSITSQEYSFNNFEDMWVKRFIDNESDISAIYNILMESTCSYGRNANVDFINMVSLEYIMNTSVHLCIELQDGTIIDSIYYRPDHHYFFDCNTMMVFMVDSDEYEEGSTHKNGEYLDTMLGFSHHKSEPSNPNDWVILAQATPYSNATLELWVHQNSLSKNFNGLYIGQDFVIEKLVDTVWTELEYNDDYSETDGFPFYVAIPADLASAYMEISIPSKYKYPDAGIYRVKYKIYDSNSKDISNPTYKEYIAEFVLSEENVDPFNSVYEVN